MWFFSIKKSLSSPIRVRSSDKRLDFYNKTTNIWMSTRDVLALNVGILRKGCIMFVYPMLLYFVCLFHYFRLNGPYRLDPWKDWSNFLHLRLNHSIKSYHGPSTPNLELINFISHSIKLCSVDHESFFHFSYAIIIG